MLFLGSFFIFSLMCHDAISDSDYSSDLILLKMTELVKESGGEWLNLPPFNYSDPTNAFQVTASRGNLVAFEKFARLNTANTTVYGLTLYLNIPVHWVGMTAQYKISYTGEGGDCTYTQNVTANEYDDPVMTVWISVADITTGTCYAELDQIQANSIDDPALGPPVPETCGAIVRDQLNSLLFGRFLYDLHYTAVSFLRSAIEKALINLNLCADMPLLVEGKEDLVSDIVMKY